MGIAGLWLGSDCGCLQRVSAEPTPGNNSRSQFGPGVVTGGCADIYIRLRLFNEATMPTSDPVQTLQDIRTYLLEGFSQVTIAPLADAKTGSSLINILQARRRWAVEVTDTFLDANSNLPHPLDAVRKWDLIGMLRSAESGSIVRVTTSGLRFI